MNFWHHQSEEEEQQQKSSGGAGDANNAAVEQKETTTLFVYANWQNWNAWQAMLSGAARQIDDAADGSHVWYRQNQYALPLLVEARDIGGKVQWASRTDAVRGLTRPINRPRCELQATCRVLAALLRLGGTGREKWTNIVIDVFGSHYIATHATLPRLRRWHKHGYKRVANRDLWEQIRLALERLDQAGIEFRFTKR